MTTAPVCSQISASDVRMKSMELPQRGGRGPHWVGTHSLLSNSSVFASDHDKLFFSGTLIRLFFALSSMSHVSALVCYNVPLKQVREKDIVQISFDSGMVDWIRIRSTIIPIFLREGGFIIQIYSMSIRVLGFLGGGKDMKETNCQKRSKRKRNDIEKERKSERTQKTNSLCLPFYQWQTALRFI